MAKIRKIYDQTIKPDGTKTTVYPITSTRAVYTTDNITVDKLLGEGYRFGGVITPAETPTILDQRVFYIANIAGSYPHCGNLSIEDGEVAALTYAKGYWRKFHISTMGSNLTGYKAITDVSQLPAEETSFGYLLDGNLYVWVGTGGDTAEGMYQNCGSFQGPQGPEGPANIPDEEDITVDEDGYLKFRDRDSGHGMGYIILRRGASLSTQMVSPNTIYEIRYNFNLGNAEITIPDGCILKFAGGSISNGTLIGTNTTICSPVKQIFDTVTIQGSWLNDKLYLDWFKYSLVEHANNTPVLDALFALQNDDIQQEVIIPPVNLWVSADTIYNPVWRFCVIKLKSNTKLTLKGNLRLNANAFEHYYIIQVAGNNCCIEGGGSIYGDVETHTGASGEYGHCIHAAGVKNLIIRDITVGYAWGDGIGLDSSDDASELGDLTYATDGVLIENVKSIYNRRQGLSIEGASNVEVRNCEFLNTGQIARTAPTRGIDIEPWRTHDTNINIHIHHCIFKNNYNGPLAIWNQSRSAKNIHIHDIEAAGSIGLATDNCVIENVVSTVNVDCSTCSNITFRNMTIGFIMVSSSNNTADNFSFFNCNIIGKTPADDYYKAIIDLHSWQNTANNWTFNSCTFTRETSGKDFIYGTIVGSYKNFQFTNCSINIEAQISICGRFINCNIKSNGLYLLLNNNEYNKRIFENCVLDLNNSTQQIQLRTEGDITIRFLELVDCTFIKAYPLLSFNYFGNLASSSIRMVNVNLPSYSGLETVLSNISGSDNDIRMISGAINDGKPIYIINKQAVYADGTPVT